MAFRKERMRSYVVRGNNLISDGKTQEAMKLVVKGLQYYSRKVIQSLFPYAKADAGLVVITLRYIADKVEENNPGTKEFVEEMSKCIVFPEFEEIEKIQKANRQ